VQFDDLRSQAAGKPPALRRLRRLEATHAELTGELDDLLRRTRILDRELRGAIQKLDREYGAYLLRGPMQDLREKYCEVPRVLEFLSQVEAAVLDSLESIATALSAVSDGSEPSAEAATPELFESFQVNVVVDNTGATGPPVRARELADTQETCSAASSASSIARASGTAIT
jgi:hypothetical protein